MLLATESLKLEIILIYFITMGNFIQIKASEQCEQCTMNELNVTLLLSIKVSEIFKNLLPDILSLIRLSNLKFSNCQKDSDKNESLFFAQGFVKEEELFPFCDLTSSFCLIYKQRTN